MKRIISVLNLVTLLFAIAVNYLVNGKQSGLPSISSISAKYDTLITPAGYTFAIWGLIYLAMLVFSIYHLRESFKKESTADFIPEINCWFMIANLANAAWVVAFTNQMIGLSVLIMLVLFISLLKVVININMEKWDAPVPIIAYIWWPFSLYFGWINMALIANISAWFTFLGWTGAPLDPVSWTIIILLVAAVIFITMTWTRNMREYASVGAWGIIGVAVKNWNTQPAIAWTAVIIAVIILINTGVHGYKNRATAPFSRRIKAV